MRYSEYTAAAALAAAKQGKDKDERVNLCYSTAIYALVPCVGCGPSRSEELDARLLHVKTNRYETRATNANKIVLCCLRFTKCGVTPASIIGTR